MNEQVAEDQLDISVVIPLLDEEASLPELAAWIEKVMTEHQFGYEIIFVDDGSTDASWQVIGQLASANSAIRGISLLRNYGKSAALQMGFNHVRGQVVITMDADLQDSPDEIPELYHMIIHQGYDLVSGWKKKRYDPITKTLPTKLFNAVTRRMSGIKLHDFNCGLKAYRLATIRNVHLYGEMHRYIPVIAKWAGFKKIGEKVVQHRARKYGTTKFGLERFINGFLDLLSISFVLRFRKKPMHFFGIWGVLFFLIGFANAFWLVGEKAYYAWVLSKPVEREVVEQPLFFLSLAALLIGVQLFLTGFVAELITLNAHRKDEYGTKDQIGID